jgi:hypothetical protein
MLKGSRYVGPALYGLLLGPGFLTRIPSALFYVYALALVAFATPREGILAGVVFGFSYAFSVLLLGRVMRNASSSSELNIVTSAVQRVRRASLVVAATAVALLPLIQLG